LVEGILSDPPGRRRKLSDPARLIREDRQR